VSTIDSHQQTPQRIPNLRWSWTDLTFALNGRKLVISRRSRPELAHLTVGWGNRSGETDFHLTYGHEGAMAGEREKDHKPLFVVTPEMLQLAGQAIEPFLRNEALPFLLNHFRRYRPGWLARRGYMVLLAGEQHFRGLVERVAPKAGRKHRVDLRELVSPATHAAMLNETIYSPEILVCPEWVAEVMGPSEIKLPVTATRVRGGGLNQGDTIILQYGPDPKGVVGWCGIMNRHMATFSARMCWMLYDWLVPRIGAPHVKVLERVVAGMALDEIEDLRPVVEAARSFMQNPTNPVPPRKRCLIDRASAS